LRVCRELEERARSGELDGAGELADRIDHEYVALAEALRRSGSSGVVNAVSPSGTILIVDDPVNRLLLAAAWNSRATQSCLRNTAARRSSCCAGGLRPDLARREMPELDGYQAGRATGRSASRDIPVLVTRRSTSWTASSSASKWGEDY
jgi:hypothetical protein